MYTIIGRTSSVVLGFALTILRLEAATNPGTLRFEPNVGQSVSDAAFVCRAAGYTISLSPGVVTFGSGGHAISLHLLGSNPAAKAVGLYPLPSVTHYLI